MTAPCTHPPERQFYTWYYDAALDGNYMWMGCTACGKLLTGACELPKGDPCAPQAYGPQHRLSPKAKKRKKSKKKAPRGYPTP